MIYSRQRHSTTPSLILSLVLGLLVALTSLLTSINAVAQSNSGGFAYKPPLRGAPAARVGGGTRGLDANTTLTVLAPDHAGYTAQSRPKLFWYISGPANMTVEMTINKPEAVEPVFEHTLKSPTNASIQSLALADYGVELQPDIEYEWFVALVPDPQQRSNDVLSGAVIKRVALDSNLQTKLNQVSKAEQARLYAENGLWYDSIETLSEQIATQPGDRTLREQRAQLLEQVGLDTVAAFDRQAK